MLITTSEFEVNLPSSAAIASMSLKESDSANEAFAVDCCWLCSEFIEFVAEEEEEAADNPIGLSTSL